MSTPAPMSVLFSIGFRPFYLAAALFAALAVPAWYAAYSGTFALDPALPPYLWHAHEMVFGFAPAVIVGFLLTAVRNWTGRPTPSGMGLAALLGLWLAARVLLLTGPGVLAAVADGAFLLTAAAVLAIPLWRSRNRRNAFVVPLLTLLAVLTLTHHAALGGHLGAAWVGGSTTVAMDLVALLLTVVAGRIIPNFSANAVPGLVPWRSPIVESLAIGLVVLIVVLELTGLAGGMPGPLWRGLLIAAAAVHLLRLIGWKPWATRHDVLLLVLPLGYLWLPVHFGLRAWLDAGPGQMASTALHTLSVGAMAGLMLAMMTRSALGHTGRPLRAGRGERLMFAAIHLAALTRVAGTLLWPAAHSTWVGVSAGLWMLAFGAFVVVYAPILWRPRVA
ncbi:MAG: NnrS family protein [Gammaproteobacteria bacterium]|jgi:uncharacterized protein involved in response to NO|nr:NnrS family protein [Gammaproteobacteria bacterium]